MPFGGQFEDAELERQFQEEIRRRQQHQHQHQQQLNSYHHGLMMPGASDPYYAASRPQYPPGYGTAAESGYDPNSKSAATAAIAHYYAAEQQRRQAAAAALQQQQAPHHPGYAGYRHGMADPRWMAAAAQAAANSYGSPSPYGREAPASAYLQEQQRAAPAPPKSQGASSGKPAATNSSTAKASPPSKHLSIEEQAAAVGEEEEEGDTHPPMKTALTKSGKPRKQRSPRVKELQELRTIMKKSVLHQHRQQGNEILDENGERKWFTGCVPLGLPDDKYWLSELQGYLRHNFAEAFGATEEDIAAPMHGRNKPIALGQVGIRCMHCKDDNPAERGQQSTSYPSQISGIYNSVQQMLRLHYDCCLSMPTHVRQRIESLRITCSSRGGRKQYWIESAKRLGLVDTPHGIHFIRDPSGPVPPLTDVRACMDKPRKKKAIAPAPEAEESKKEEDEDGGSDAEQKPPALVKKRAASPLILERPPQPPPDARPLVFPNDKPLISDYLYLTLEQMAPCNLMEADRVGCYKNRDINFPGLACRHCVGQAGSGRYFPASEASLSQTTTSQTIMNHVRNCRRCPIEIRENLEIMKRNRMGPDGKRADKPKHGGRKVFFHRLWCRIQNVPFEEGKGERRETKSPKKQPKKSSKSGKKKKAKGGRRKSSKFSDDSNTDTEEDTDTEDDGEQEDSEEDSKPKARERSGSRSTPVLARRKVSPWFEGCVRLAKDDDFHWIVDMECHVRKEFVEVFSLKKNDRLDGYTGRKEPATGQAGIRCVFCANAGTGVRSNGCIAFPDMLSSIHTKVKDMIRLHFPNCPNMPEKQRRTWKTMKDYDAQGVANDDAAQYWVDAARDLGLANIPPAGIGAPGAWGVTFRRDPSQPSPADQLDENLGEDAVWGKNYLVRPADRGLCTDYVLLLLCQVRPCRFRKSDRRAGPGSRGRDRAMGFPGLACMHCANKNSLGRYFPVSAKNLTDNTANSLQAHISSCSRCPEHIQASLGYLSHRSILQKAELSGSWKKSFFKKVWDRLHNDRTWTAIENEDEEEMNGGNESVQSLDEESAAAGYDDEKDEDENGDDDEGDDNSEKEEMGDQMNALIKAAAIWLTEQDEAQDTTRQGRSSKGRTLPSKRRGEASSNGSKGGRGATSLPTSKRRRTNN